MDIQHRDERRFLRKVEAHLAADMDSHCRPDGLPDGHPAKARVDAAVRRQPWHGPPWFTSKLEQFQEKCEAVFRPELRQNKELEQFQEKCEAVFRPELRQNKELEQFIVSAKR